MRLIVTRPAAQAADWVQALLALGHHAVSLPLIDIAAVDDAAPLHAAWRSLAGQDLVMFVSANAVAHFFAAVPPGATWPGPLRAACTGPGTAAALQAAGLAPAQVVAPATDAASFDSETLWLQLSGEDWRDRRVLVVRGEEGRDWLADTLRERGATVGFVAAYGRRAPRPDVAELALLAQAQQAPAEHLWLLSSSEAVGNLQALAEGADWSKSRALASHPRIAQAARAAGFGDVRLAAAAPQAVAEAAAGWASIQSAAL